MRTIIMGKVGNSHSNDTHSNFSNTLTSL